MTTTELPAHGPGEAPRIGPGVYPFHGRSRLGPIWREIWTTLGDGSWHKAQTLAMDLAIGTGEANPRAVATMLANAGRRGTLEREIRAGYLWVRRPGVQVVSEQPAAVQMPRIDPPRVPATARRGAR